MNITTSSTSSSGTFEFGNGFWWDGQWHEVRPSHGDDDGPPTGVREPRRPHPSGPPPMAAAVEYADV